MTSTTPIRAHDQKGNKVIAATTSQRVKKEIVTTIASTPETPMKLHPGRGFQRAFILGRTCDTPRRADRVRRDGESTCGPIRKDGGRRDDTPRSPRHCADG